jgi:hypothetical protein
VSYLKKRKRNFFKKKFGRLKVIFKLSQNHPGFLSPILLSLSPWRLWRKHLIGKKEKINKKGLKFLSGAKAKGGLEFWEKKT